MRLGAQGRVRVAPVKGLEGFNRSGPVTGPTYVDAIVGGKRLRRGARLRTVATSTFRAETYRYLRQERPTREELEAGAVFPLGTIHLPDWADGEWFKELTAEQLLTVKAWRGFSKLDWQKLRERHEALDLRVYARAAAWIAGADRGAEARWGDFEAQVGLSSDALSVSIAGKQLPATRSTMPRRRRVTYMSFAGRGATRGENGNQPSNHLPHDSKRFPKVSSGPSVVHAKIFTTARLGHGWHVLRGWTYAGLPGS